MAYEKPKSHKRQTLSEFVTKSKKGGVLGDPYSVASLRKNMNTGGGQPIPKGHKLTNERRVLQPRDPVTQQFEYNSSADLGLKDRSRGKKIPIAARRMGFNSNMVEKSGNVAIIDKRAWIRNGGEQISEADVVEYFKRFHEDSGEFVNNANETFTSSWQRKRGRTNKFEKGAIARNKFVPNENVTDFDTYFKAVKAQGAGIKKEHLAKLSPNSVKYKSNYAWNDSFSGFMDAAKKAGYSEEQVFEHGTQWSETDPRYEKEQSSLFNAMRDTWNKGFEDTNGDVEAAKKAVYNMFSDGEVKDNDNGPEDNGGDSGKGPNDDGKGPDDDNPPSGGSSGKGPNTPPGGGGAPSGGESKPAGGGTKMKFAVEKAKQDPKKYYEENKEFIDEKLKAYNEKTKSNWGAYKYVMSLINKYDKK